MNFSANPYMVRVDFFKPSGKWYSTEEMEWLNYHGLIHEVFSKSLHRAFSTNGKAGYSGMTAVCLHPYHEHEHPLMLPCWDKQDNQ